VSVAKTAHLTIRGLGRMGTRDLLEIVEDRYNTSSLIITSQVPIGRWYEIVGDPTLAEAVLDRVVHAAHRIELKGESLRKLRAAA
jgi:DNA replication protein DnaC